MKYLILILVSAFLTNISFSQTPCPNRYTFEQFSVDSIFLITGGGNGIYYMYQPLGDIIQKRAFIIIIQDGDFKNIMVDNRLDELQKIHEFTKRGFVVMSVNQFYGEHSFYDHGCDTAIVGFNYWKYSHINIIKSILFADLDYDFFRIDTDNIWLYGMGSGAEIAYSLVYDDSISYTEEFPVMSQNAPWNLIPIKHEFRGLIIHGELGKDTSRIDYNKPQISFWDSGFTPDTITHICRGFLNGPRRISQKIQSNGVCSRVFTATNGDSIAFSDQFIVEQSSCFILENMCGMCMSGEYADTVGTMHMCQAVGIGDEIKDKEFYPEGEVKIYDLNGKEIWGGILKEFKGQKGIYLINQNNYWFKYLAI